MTSPTEHGVRLAIVGDMTIYHAAAQKQQLLDALAGTERLDLDLSGVGEIDTAGVQLLILAKREARRLGKTVHLVAHSAAVSEAVEFFNLAVEFGDPMLIPARDC